MGVNSLPKIVTRQRGGCDLNSGPSAPESSTLTTGLPSHRGNVQNSLIHGNAHTCINKRAHSSRVAESYEYNHSVHEFGIFIIRSFRVLKLRSAVAATLPRLAYDGKVGGVPRRMNEVNARRARLVLRWVTVFGRVYHLGM